jgi:hypothetical protein
MWQDSDSLYNHLFQSPIESISFNVYVPVARTYGDDVRAM